MQPYWLPKVTEPQQSLAVAQVEPSTPQLRTSAGSLQWPLLQVPPLQHCASPVQVAPNGWHAPTGFGHIARQWLVPSQLSPSQHGASEPPQLSFSAWQVHEPPSQPRPEQQSVLAVQLCAFAAQHAPLVQVVPSQQSASAPHIAPLATQPQVVPPLQTRPGQQCSPLAQVSPDIEQMTPSSS
jgi:hypothetical protein